MANYLAILILRHQQNLVAAVTEFMQTVIGAYSALVIYDGKMLAFRDPLGFRPMVMGCKQNTWYVASETCALDIALAHSQNCDIHPGELVVFEPNKPPQIYQLIKKDRLAQCLFELIYFARPDSSVFGISASYFREFTGGLLAKRYPVKADIVIPVPDSSNSTALGYAYASGIPFAFGLTRNHDVGRTFIEELQFQRDASVREKLNPDRRVLEGKNVVVVDDSIVRGTTSKKIILMIKTPKEGRMGAKEVHLRIGSPTIIQCCFYGIDTKTPEQLIAANKSVEEIRAFTTADSLYFSTIDDMDAGVAACGGNPADFCKTCFGEAYQTAL